ncbi:unnamed protein product [Ixodes persulcatus]
MFRKHGCLEVMNCSSPPPPPPPRSKKKQTSRCHVSSVDCAAFEGKFRQNFGQSLTCLKIGSAR